VRRLPLGGRPPSVRRGTTELGLVPDPGHHPGGRRDRPSLQPCLTVPSQRWHYPGTGHRRSLQRAPSRCPTFDGAKDKWGMPPRCCAAGNIHEDSANRAGLTVPYVERHPALSSWSSGRRHAGRRGSIGAPSCVSQRAGNAQLLDSGGHKDAKGSRHRQRDNEHSNAACLGNRWLRPSDTSSP